MIVILITDWLIQHFIRNIAVEVKTAQRKISTLEWAEIEAIYIF